MPLSVRHYRVPLYAGLIGLLLMLSGCQMVSSNDTSCEAGGRPLLKDSDCSLRSWVSFAFTAQRANQAWRDKIESEAPSSSLNDRLIRAVAMGWSDDQQELVQAQRLYRSGVEKSPQRLRAFFQLLQADTENRIDYMKLVRAHQELSASYRDSSSQASKVDQLARENADLKRKINELAAIESQWDKERGQR
ncbi:hypothetical protein [Carnimonas bestiolae]|uniref:hypothetical protein n=1 Tax=Carnimonas bestiolae TaxID=3402172 RepID=UPI003EDC8F62